MNKWTKEQALTLALAEALAKNDKGLLFPAGSVFATMDNDKGDPETIYSIASMYSDQPENDGTWEDAIIGLLSEEFPDFD
jgi:hypothetical protein